MESIARQEQDGGPRVTSLQASNFGKPIPPAAPGRINPQKVFKALRGRCSGSGLLEPGCFEGAAWAVLGDLAAGFSGTRGCGGFLPAGL